MESMQKAWGFSSPQPMAPTLDIDEIDQRLKDLNAVSQWLALNQSMLQSTIQALQVQRATIGALKSFGTPGAMGGSDGSSISPVDMMQAFAQAFTNPGTDKAATESSADPEQPPDEAPDADQPTGTDSASSGKTPLNSNPGLDPQQWWAMLQQQFAQVANAAIVTDPPGKSPTAASKKKSPSSKPGTKSK